MEWLLYGWSWWMNTICIFIRTFMYLIAHMNYFCRTLPWPTARPSSSSSSTTFACEIKCMRMHTDTDTDTHTQTLRSAQFTIYVQLWIWWLLTIARYFFLFNPKNLKWSLFCIVLCLRRMICYIVFLFRSCKQIESVYILKKNIMKNAAYWPQLQFSSNVADLICVWGTCSSLPCAIYLLFFFSLYIWAHVKEKEKEKERTFCESLNQRCWLHTFARQYN